MFRKSMVLLLLFWITSVRSGQAQTCLEEVGFVDTPGVAYGVAVVEGYAYVADDTSGLRVIDVSTPSAPREVGYVDTPGYAYGVAVIGGYAYVADYTSDLRVIDVSMPTAPSEVGFVDTPGAAEDVVVAGGYAYVAASLRGLRVIDVSTPTAPREVGSVETPGVAYGVAVAEGYAYVADSTQGLRVIDVSTPTAPREVGSVETPGFAFGVAVAGEYAYVADFASGLRVIDVSTPTAPREVGFVDTPGYAFGVAVAGGYAYVADDTSGLRVIDVSMPTAPSEVGFVDTPGAGYDVAVAGGYAYIADFLSGLRVIDVSCFPGGVEESCFDGLDDDDDELVDCADPDCDGATGGACDTGLPGMCSSGTRTCSEGLELCIPNSGSDEGPFGDPTCSDDLDNDCDGLVDGSDPDCTPPEVEICFDGIDNDGDGLADCLDPDCDGATDGPCDTGLPGICGPGTWTCSGGVPICVQNEEAGQEGPVGHPNCFDSLDNDCDGLTDSADSDCQVVEYVALGDSYSSGEGTYAYDPGTNQLAIMGGNMCHRSSEQSWSGTNPGEQNIYTVPGLGQGQVTRNLFACSGSVSANLFLPRLFLPSGLGPEDEPGQLSHSELNSADMVSITIGGNDALFAKVLKECITSLVADCSSPAYIPNGDPEALTTQVDQALAQLRVALPNRYSDIKSAAPEASVFVVGYPQVIPIDLHFPCPAYLRDLEINERVFMNGIGDRLNLAAKCGAMEAGVHFVPLNGGFVPPNQEFAGHEVCGSAGRDWIWATKSFFWKEMFHPKDRGYEAISAALASYIMREGRGTIPRNPDPIDPLPPGCASQFVGSAVGGVIYESGPLDVSAADLGCDTGGQFVAGQSIRVIGGGFAPGASVDFWLSSEGLSENFGQATADSEGTVDTVWSVPLGAPPSGLGFVKGIGEPAEGGGSRSLYASIEIVSSTTTDTDTDGIPDICDNCVDDQNDDQEDSDQDGLGDACDACPFDPEDDFDSDGLCADVDPCPFDPDNDLDGDGYCGDIDGCPAYPNPPGTAIYCVFGDGLESGDTSAWSSTVP